MSLNFSFEDVCDAAGRIDPLKFRRAMWATYDSVAECAEALGYTAPQQVYKILDGQVGAMHRARERTFERQVRAARLARLTVPRAERAEA